MERQPDPAARRAGLLLVLTAAATVVAVIGRVGAAADHSTLAESLVAISESKGLYGIGGAARFISGVTLIASAWFLLRTWIIRERLGTPLVPLLFIVSGLLYGRVRCGRGCPSRICTRRKPGDGSRSPLSGSLLARPVSQQPGWP